MGAQLSVAVLAGGRSSEHDVSLSSAAAIYDGLREAGHDAFTIEIGRDGVWRRDGVELELHPGRGLTGADVVFPALHGPFGEDGALQGLLEMLDVPYVGSAVEASALCMDKVRFKALMAGRGIAQVEYEGIDAVRWRFASDNILRELGRLSLPVFVKPARLGSSVGIAKVDAGGEQMRTAIDEAFRHDEVVIVEAASPGIEVECGLLEHQDGTVTASLPGRIEFDAEWYDYAAKYSDGGMRLVIPAGLPERVAARLGDVAREAFVAVGCAGLARADFFVDGDQVVLNELNTMPGFTPFSVYARLLEASGVPYPELVDRLCRLALARGERRAAMRY